MKKIFKLFVLLFSGASHAGEYSDCVLESLKGVDAPAAINAIKQACKEKALPYVPANCKNLTLKHPVSIQYTEFSESYSALNEKDIECVNKCLDASYWSKHFGDCKE